MERIKGILIKYIPESSANIIAEWIVKYKIHLTITKNRASKSGDYRHPYSPKFIHRITVNHNLNKYAFLITLVHEIAHLLVWNKFKNSKLPHGREWKDEFREMLHYLLKINVFPKEIISIIVDYAKNPTASSGSDHDLYMALKKFDDNKDSFMFLDDIPNNSVFKLLNGRTFTKGEKLRTRYKCLCHNDKRTYLVNGIAEVNPVKN